MIERILLSRRAMGRVVAGFAAMTCRLTPVRATTPDGAGAVPDMIEALQSADALSFTADAVFGASATNTDFRNLGTRVHVVFQRPGTLFAVFGEGGGPDLQMLISGGEVTLLRLSLASKTVLKLVPGNGAAFAVPGLFLPFMGLLSENVEVDFFGGIQSVTPIAQGAPDQPEETMLNAVMGHRFTGEVWTDKGSGRPARVIGTWFGGDGGKVAASAAVNFTGWSSEAPVASAFTPQGLDAAKMVDFSQLGL